MEGGLSYKSTQLRTLQLEVDADWARLPIECAHLTQWGCDMLQGGLRDHAKTVLIEPHYVCKDFRNLYSHFYSKKFVPRDNHCARLHFFSSRSLTVDAIVGNSKQHQDSYLGYSVVQPVREKCLGRSCYDPFKLGRDPAQFYCLQAKSRVHINGANYTVSGFPHMPQSGEAMVCAHAALWGMCRYLSDRFRTYREVYPNDLIGMTGASAGRRVPYRGMTYGDYSEILTAFGCHPVIVRPEHKTGDWTRDRARYYDLYSYVESGIPVLTSFNGHVATLIGHTLRKDTGLHVPEFQLEGSDVYNSFALVGQYIVADDNFFPYVHLDYRGEADNYGNAFTPAKLDVSIDGIFVGVAPMPEKVFLRPEDARNLAYGFFRNSKVAPLIKQAATATAGGGDKLIARLFMTSGTSLKQRKLRAFEAGPGQDPLLLIPVNLTLPHFVWVMELGVLSRYNQGFVVAEVVLDATTSAAECTTVYLRAGRTVFLGNQPKFEKLAPAEFQLYTHNLGERDVGAT